MKKKAFTSICMILLLGVILSTLGCGVDSETETAKEESSFKVEESSVQEMTEQEETVDSEQEELQLIRWGIIGQYDDNNEGEQNNYVDLTRSQNLNEILKAKGFDFEVEIVYVDDSYTGDHLQTALKQEENFDIISYNPRGIGVADMEEYFVALEEYMGEGEIMNDLYQVYSEKIWKANQINGHNYNAGQLVSAIAPVYSVITKNQETEPEHPDEIFTTDNTQEITLYTVEKEGIIILSEPYFEGSYASLFVEGQFHIIAPGVGLDVDEASEFENVWESDYVEERLEEEKNWIQDGVASSGAGGSILMGKPLRINRLTNTMNEAKVFVYEQTDGQYMYTHYYPVLEQTCMMPMSDQYHTSVMKGSEQIENCVLILNALNTDAEICTSIYEDPAQTGGAKISTGNFVYLCNYYIATDDYSNAAQLQNERVEVLEEDQISPILGFTFDRTLVEEEMKKLEETLYMELNFEYVMKVTQKITEVEDDPEQYKEVLSQVWAEEFEAYKQKLKDAGIDKVIEEANRQLAEWRAANGK